jgi:hypothetical protein
MDKWKDIELEKMKAGGNAKFREFLQTQEDYDPGWSLQDKYNSRAAALFRDKVKTGLASSLCMGHGGWNVALVALGGRFLQSAVDICINAMHSPGIDKDFWPPPERIPPAQRRSKWPVITGRKGSDHNASGTSWLRCL